jgi:site-specific DNA-methyltransferase (adenine-specific)
MKKYQIIYADPPWKFSSKMKGSRGQYKLDEHYPQLSCKDICNLPIKELADENCILFIWTTDAHIPEALYVIKSWGFKYKTVGFVWNKKEKSGIQVCYCGMWTMKGTELCFLATRNHPKKVKNNVRQLVEAERKGHSIKPDEVRNRIVTLMGDLPRIELFARQKTEGWDVWGNEVKSDIDLTTTEGLGR